MPSARENRKLPALFLGAAMVLLVVGPGLAAEPVATDIMTTGHTNYINAGTTFNNCFAGIAGAMLQRVVWFNGATLFSRMTDGDGDTFIYAMEHFNDHGYDSDGDGGKDVEGADSETGIKPFDPSEETLFETGNSWNIQDENRASIVWNITEYYALAAKGDSIGADIDGPGDTGAGVGEDESVDQEKVYVWVVQVGQAIEDPTIRREYNFVTLVDTCKFHHDQSGEVDHSDGHQGDPNDPQTEEDDHDPNDVPEGEGESTHPHPTYNVDLFVGGEPDSIPTPADPPLPDGGGSSS